MITVNKILEEKQILLHLLRIQYVLSMEYLQVLEKNKEGNSAS